jgi:hypothetical protein
MAADDTPDLGRIILPTGPEPVPEPVKACGPCTACCALMAVEELNKPAGKRCDHLTAAGCGIYEERPQTCREFQCSWHLNDLDTLVLPGADVAEYRPDALGVMLTVVSWQHPDSKQIMPLVQAIEIDPEATERPRVQKLVSAIVVRGLNVLYFHANGVRRLFRPETGQPNRAQRRKADQLEATRKRPILPKR